MVDMQLSHIAEPPASPYVSSRFYGHQMPKRGQMMLLDPFLISVLLLENFYSICIT